MELYLLKGLWSMNRVLRVILHQIGVISVSIFLALLLYTSFKFGMGLIL